MRGRLRRHCASFLRMLHHVRDRAGEGKRKHVLGGLGNGLPARSRVKK